MKKIHYYPDLPKDSWRTACGRDGRKTGGFIKFFFRVVKQSERCKTCDKQFRKEELKRRY